MADWDGGTCVFCKKKIEKPGDAVIAMAVVRGNPYQHYWCFQGEMRKNEMFARPILGAFSGNSSELDSQSRVARIEGLTARDEVQRLMDHSNFGALLVTAVLDVLIMAGLSVIHRITFSWGFAIAFGILCLAGLIMTLGVLLYYVRLHNFNALLKSRKMKNQ